MTCKDMYNIHRYELSHSGEELSHLFLPNFQECKFAAPYPGIGSSLLCLSYVPWAQQKGRRKSLCWGLESTQKIFLTGISPHLCAVSVRSRTTPHGVPITTRETQPMSVWHCCHHACTWMQAEWYDTCLHMGSTIML